MQDVLIPFYDRYLNILYVTGKGDSSIKYYEYKNGIFNVNANSHKSNVSGKVLFLLLTNIELCFLIKTMLQ